MSVPTPVCGFCGQPSDLMVSGPGVYACHVCVMKAREVITQTQQNLFHCSFCGESATIDSVVAGPNGLHMCIGCVESGIRLLTK